MSSSDNNNQLPIPQLDEQQTAEQQQQPKEQPKEQQKPKKATSWAKKSNLATRSAGIDVIKRSLGAEINVDQSKTSFLNLPIVPSYVTECDLITTGSNDFTSTIESLTNFFETNELLTDKKFYLEGTNIHGSYRNTDLCANSRFSCYLYRTKNGEIAYHVTRVDGCGIAFARLFHAINQELGSNKQREICTFQAPPLLNTLQINTLETHYSNLSQSNQDSCVFEHGISSPISWSLQTLENMCESIHKLHQKVAQSGQMSDIIIPSDEIIIPIDDDDEPIELPLPPKAQAHMITQSFDMLNAGLAAISNITEWAQVQPVEFLALSNFIQSLFTQQENGYTHLAALLNHLSLDVKISTLQFLNLIIPARLDLVDQLPGDLLGAVNDEAVQIINDNACQPFEFISYETIVANIQSLEKKCYSQ